MVPFPDKKGLSSSHGRVVLGDISGPVSRAAGKAQVLSRPLGAGKAGHQQFTLLRLRDLARAQQFWATLRVDGGHIYCNTPPQEVGHEPAIRKWIEVGRDM